MTATSENSNVVYLLRGLPSCGKSTLARELVGDTGLICETDEFFYTECGNDPQQYDYDKDRLDEARRWNFERFKAALDRGVSPIVVDRGNGLNPETRAYAQLAVDRGYSVELAEPDSPWWRDLRVLLKYKDAIAPELFDRFAEALAQKNRATHRTPASPIRRWMKSWRTDLTIEDILASPEES